MKKLLLIVSLLPLFANGQSIVYPGGCCLGNTTFTFSTSDSLTHYILGDTLTIDTSAGASSTVLWQIGSTVKPVFSNDTTPVRGIMTDTIHPYPARANSFFVVKIGALRNCIVDFWHTYETDSLHAGGIVEFSTDTGQTWINAANCPDLNTQNLYSATDTIVSGQAAFTGASIGQQLSRVQFFNCMALRGTSTECFPNLDYYGGIWVRFRFVSDTTTDSLSGWAIDSIEVEYPGCGEGVENVGFNDRTAVFPNPATTTLNVSAEPPVRDIAITNLLGQTVYSRHYDEDNVQIDVTGLPPGIYLIRINGTSVQKLVKE